MSTAVLRGVVATVLIVHGLGHAQGILAALGVRLGRSHSADSRVLTPLLGDSWTRIVGAIAWLAALLLFVASGLAPFGWLLPVHAWATLAVTVADFSSIVLALFWNGLAFLFPNKIGAIVVNVAVLVCLLVVHWPSDVVAGSG